MVVPLSLSRSSLKDHSVFTSPLSSNVDLSGVLIGATGSLGNTVRLGGKGTGVPLVSGAFGCLDYEQDGALRGEVHDVRTCALVQPAGALGSRAGKT